MLPAVDGFLHIAASFAFRRLVAYDDPVTDRGARKRQLAIVVARTVTVEYRLQVFPPSVVFRMRAWAFSS
jgi:hypothetical protein